MLIRVWQTSKQRGDFTLIVLPPALIPLIRKQCRRWGNAARSHLSLGQCGLLLLLLHCGLARTLLIALPNERWNDKIEHTVCSSCLLSEAAQGVLHHFKFPGNEKKLTLCDTKLVKKDRWDKMKAIMIWLQTATLLWEVLLFPLTEAFISAADSWWTQQYRKESIN